MCNDIDIIILGENHVKLIFGRGGKCGSWSFDGNRNKCYLHDSDGCCDQFNKRVPDENFVSGYICPNCWSTKNDCPCSKDEREAVYNSDFIVGNESPDHASSTVSLSIYQNLNTRRQFHFTVFIVFLDDLGNSKQF